MGNMIITISREYGSGGHIIGKKLAGEMNIPFYDKNLLTRAADESGFDEAVFENADERAPSSLLYSLSTGIGLASAGIFDAAGLPLDDQLFVAQFDTIRKLAREGSCVIVGRCADYILKDEPRCMNVFIHADLSYRIGRVAEESGITDKEAEDKIAKIDKRRIAYYKYYTTQKWGMARNYHLSIDSGVLGTENAVSLIRACAAMLPFA